MADVDALGGFFGGGFTWIIWAIVIFFIISCFCGGGLGSFFGGGGCGCGCGDKCRCRC